MPKASPNIGPSDKYDAFLAASLAEQENGTPVSVLSALIRANRDPWQEASRLAELPPDRAKRALVEMLNEVLERQWSLTESEDLAKHLVQLLPYTAPSAVLRPQATNSPDGARLVVYWAFWIAFFLLISLSQDREHMRHANTGQTAGVPIKQLSPDPGVRKIMNFGVERSRGQSFEATRPYVE
jgi:hypothetical protein